jgi:RHS repeat-associated protein
MAPVAFTYTPTGRRETATDERGTTRYEYDTLDRLAALLYPDGRKLEYAYDGNGNRTRLTAVLADGTRLDSENTYDDANRLDLVVDPLGRTHDHGYDAAGNRTSLSQPNGTRTDYAYDGLNRLTALSTAHPASGRTVQSYGFTLGPAGNRTAITEHDGTVRSYTYDDLYRLTGEKVTVSGLLEYEKTFGYDAVGNRLGQSTTGSGAPGTPTAPGSISYGYDERDRLLSETLGASPPTSYTFDANGNVLTRSDGATYVWDFENRLIRVATDVGTVVEHAYDADGNRVRTRVTPPTGPPAITHYLVDTSRPLSQAVAETDEAGALRTFYVRGDDLLGLMRPDGSGGWTSRFYHADGVGSVRRLTDEGGNISDGYSYTAFGELLAHTGSDPQPFAFAAEPRDPDVGFQYHRARWFDPRLGRFASMDPFAGQVQDPHSLHKYLYTGGDPLNRVDPTGQFEFSLAGMTVSISVASTLRSMAFGFTFGALAAAGDAYLRGDDVLSAALQGGLIGMVLGPLFQIKFIAPVLVTVGGALGVVSVADAIDQGNDALAAYRAMFVLIGAVTFFKTPADIVPPTGGRLGSAATRQQNYEIGSELIRRGWTILGGAGRLPEEYLPATGGGRSGSNWVDITATKGGRTLRINTVDTYVNGLPTNREAAAAALIRQKTPGDHLLLIPKE